MKITSHKMKIMSYLYTPNSSVKIISRVAKDCDITGSHSAQILSEFENEGLIKTEVKGRVRIIQNTAKGITWFILADKLYRLMSEKNGNIKTKDGKS